MLDKPENAPENCKTATPFWDEKKLQQTLAALPNDEMLCDLSDFFKLFADSTRIKILCLLIQGKMCVCDIATALNMTSSAISHQLKALRLNKLVKFERQGKVIYYSLSDFHVSSILTQGLDHLSEPNEKNK